MEREKKKELSALLPPQYYTEIDKTAMISSPTVKLQTFEVDNLIWFKSESITWDKQNDLT